LRTMNEVGLPLADFLEEARRIVSEAREAGITLRVIGATAVKLHCPKYARLYTSFGRTLSDLDIVAFSKDLKRVKELFEKMGYTNRKMGYAVAVSAHGERLIFYDENNKRAVDVYFDRLRMCHTIEFKDRLELDSPTITLADILLEKMQIVELNEKDIKDTIVLLREHQLGETEKEVINMGYIAKLLSENWGFYYTVTTNLKKTRNSLNEYDILSKEDCEDVTSKVDMLLNTIECAPKNLSWKMRARLGTRMKWYEEVEEIYLTR